jgi:hypothetical protein
MNRVAGQPLKGIEGGIAIDRVPQPIAGVLRQGEIRNFRCRCERQESAESESEKGVNHGNQSAMAALRVKTTLFFMPTCRYHVV